MKKETVEARITVLASELAIAAKVEVIALPTKVKVKR